jgi:hypothetical protein
MANEQNLKPFVKGDPRINRKGRPKDFATLRALAQTLANEPAIGADKQPIIIDGHIATQSEMIMRTMMKDNPEKFVEIAFGKVPTPIEMTVKDDDIDAAIAKELARVAAASQAKDAGTAAIEKPVG